MHSKTFLLQPPGLSIFDWSKQKRLKTDTLVILANKKLDWIILN